MANLYSDTQRIKEAEQAYGEAETILAPLWCTTPEVHGDMIARILWGRALLSVPLGESRAYASALARRAFAAAYAPGLQEEIQRAIDQFA